MPARTPEDDLDEARKLRRRARGIKTPQTRRRMQRIAERLENRALKKYETRMKQRVRGAHPGNTPKVLL